MLGKISLNSIILAIIFIFSFLAQSCDDSIIHFSDKEKAWIANNKSNLKVTPDPAFPPIDFFDEKGNYKGVSADIIKLIEDRTGLQFSIIRTKNWNTALIDVENKKSDIVLPTQKTAERLKYLLFTEPYIEVPTVIVTTRKNKSFSSIDLLRNKRVAVIKNHAIIEQFIEPKYPFLNIILVKNAITGLLETSFGEVDAMLAELPIATYYIEKMGITNLSIAGRTSHKYDLSIASRKDMPTLNSILKKGLSSISQKELKDIKQNWIKLNWVPFYKNQYFQVFSSIIILSLIFFFLWNRVLKKEIDRRKKTELMLRESEMKFRNIIESSPMGIHLYKLEDTSKLIFTGSNPSADTILGVGNKQFVGKTIEQAFPPLTGTEIPDRYRDLCLQGGIWVKEQIEFEDEKVKGAFEVHAFQTSQNEIAVMFLDVKERKIAEKEKEKLIIDLQNALTEIKTLNGLLPICSSCKKIRDDNGYWNLLESYIENHSDAFFSHGMCPECSDKLYGKEDWYIKMKKDKRIE